MAAIRAMEHWEHLIRGRRFTLRTDHQALLQLLNSPKDKRQSSKFTRWRERLEEFDYSVEYLPGPRNAAADYLSRLESKVMVGGVLWKEIRMESGDDEDLNKVRKAIESKDWTNF